MTQAGEGTLNWFSVETGLVGLGRGDNTALVYDNRMWVIGGNRIERLNDVWYSSNGIEWTRATTAAAWSPRAAHTSVVFDERMWVLGGSKLVNGRNTKLNDVWFSSDGTTWTQAATPPWSPRVNHTSVVFDGRMWVMGGLDGSRFYNDVWFTSDGTTWTEATSAADWPPRSAHVSVVFDDKIWIITGAQNDEGPLSDTWSSPDGIEWTLENLGSGPFVSDAAAAVFDNLIWVTGGNIGGDSGANTNAIWSTEDGSAWELREFDTEFPVHAAHAAVVFNDRLWILNLAAETWFLGRSQVSAAAFGNLYE